MRSKKTQQPNTFTNGARGQTPDWHTGLPPRTFTYSRPDATLALITQGEIVHSRENRRAALELRPLLSI
jgi:hypothetical protein